jgi:hypothetical protein
MFVRLGVNAEPEIGEAWRSVGPNLPYISVTSQMINTLRSDQIYKAESTSIPDFENIEVTWTVSQRLACFNKRLSMTV